MIQRRCRARLSAEAFQSMGILRDIIREELQRDEAGQFGIFGLVDYTQPPPPSFSPMQ
jgi:hypothetical protein